MRKRFGGKKSETEENNARLQKNDSRLKRLTRAELLELLYEESREVERLRAELAAANKRLAARELAISESGSLAEAALKLSGVFDAADEAARLYIENIKRTAGADSYGGGVRKDEDA